MFKQITDKLNYHELESEILKFWEANDIFKQSIATREGKPAFTFYEGPPTANGRPGIHHVMARTLKDIVCRYKTMQGYQVSRKAGWDTHGLPVEIEVEKSLGFKHKDDIVAYGVAKFNEECKKSVWKYKTEWEQMTKEMGYWVDLDHPYVTFHNEYIESIWWALQQYFNQGLIYKGYKIQPYCPRCETPLSSHEVSLGYKDVKDPSVYVLCKIKKGQSFKYRNFDSQTEEIYAIQDDNHYFLVWTTTPWTLISNVGLAVNPNVEYTVVTNGRGQKLILAYETIDRIAKFDLEGSESILQASKKILGSSLAGIEYDRMYNFHSVKEKGWYVVLADFVTTEDGSGIVHMAPAYGEDDYQVGRKYNLPTIHPVNKSGEFNSEVTPFAGKFVKDADAEIILDLKHRGILYKKEMHLHSYPHCWRCSSPLLYYARESWYIRTTDYAKRMIDLNKQINWIPKEVGEGRFGNWLEDNKDWALSRDRYWGTPLPIWVSEDGEIKKCVGRFDELIGAEWLDEKGNPTGKIFTEEDLKTLDPHKPTVDNLVFKTADGKYLKRTPELIDVWFDSGSMPFAQWHYPFENKEVFEKAYPADFICEGIDQTRGWFYTLHSIGTFLSTSGAFGEKLKNTPAYKNVLVNELILDKQGQKMSKTKKNTVNPFELLEKYGADTVRWYLVSQSPVWRPTLFDEEGMGEVQRKFFSTLVNTYSFFALYANVDGFDNSEQTIPVSERAEIDRWILSELNSLLKTYHEYVGGYDVTHAARAISDFTIDQLSNWYVRRNRRRFWKSEKGKDKTAAYQTLHECLLVIAKLIAPFAPFLAEELYHNLTAGYKSALASVHLELSPVVNDSLIDSELEHRMEHAIKIVSIVRAMRMKSNLKVRQPLKKIILPVKNDAEQKELAQMEDVILEEINVKQIEYVTDESAVIKKKSKPNFKTLGPKFGKAVQPVAARIKELTAAEIASLQSAGTLSLTINGNVCEIDTNDVEILHEDIQGWLVEIDGAVTVALDTELTEELISEGMAREFVSRVQNLRKDSGFEVTDRIRIYHASSPRLTAALEQMTAYLKQETLAVEVNKLSSADITKYAVRVEDINGEQTSLAVEKI